MNEVLPLVLGSMHQAMTRLDTVAMNLANTQTAGYKRRIAVALPFAARLASSGDVPSAGAGAAGQAAAVHTDQRPGTLKATGQNLDLALTGPGWFEVATEHGPAHTRQGDFRLDAAGRLVTRRGQPVMGLGGEIHLLQGPVTVDAAGRVFEGAAGGKRRADAAPVAQLKLVQFEPRAAAHPLGDGLVQVQGEPASAGAEAPRVQQGFLENANVDPTHEMVQLLQSVRQMETLQKVATAYDEMLATSIRRLGEGA
jgi:flagellar basal-body rod protein FlgF